MHRATVNFPPCIMVFLYWVDLTKWIVLNLSIVHVLTSRLVVAKGFMIVLAYL